MKKLNLVILLILRMHTHGKLLLNIILRFKAIKTPGPVPRGKKPKIN